MDIRRDRQHNGRRGLAGLLALLFAFYVNYIPVHLAAETHLDDALSFVAHGLSHHDGGDDDDHDHHTPHPASDHSLTLTVTTKAPHPSALAVFLLPAILSVLLCEPDSQRSISGFERNRPPGESPPDPEQPRAPPAA